MLYFSFYKKVYQSRIGLVGLGLLLLVGCMPSTSQPENEAALAAADDKMGEDLRISIIDIVIDPEAKDNKEVEDFEKYLNNLSEPQKQSLKNLSIFEELHNIALDIFDKKYLDSNFSEQFSGIKNKDDKGLNNLCLCANLYKNKVGDGLLSVPAVEKTYECLVSFISKQKNLQEEIENLPKDTKCILAYFIYNLFHNLCNKNEEDYLDRDSLEKIMSLLYLIKLDKDPELKERIKGLFNTKDEKGEALLHKAVRNKDIQIVQFLLNLGVDVNVPTQRGITSLRIAKDSKNQEMEAWLLERGADLDTRDLCEAVAGADAERVICLLNNGASVNTCTQQGRTLLRIAKDSKNQEMAAWLLENGATLDTRDLYELIDGFSTILKSEDRTKNKERFKLLLESGADINAKFKDRCGVEKEMTLLERKVLCKIPNIDAIKLLLGCGANLNTCDSAGKSVLQQFVNYFANYTYPSLFYLKAGIAWLLIQSGADIKRLTREECIRLFHEASSNHLELFSFLLKNSPWSKELIACAEEEKMMWDINCKLSHRGTNRYRYSYTNRCSYYSSCVLEVTCLLLERDVSFWNLNSRDISKINAGEYIENYSKSLIDLCFEALDNDLYLKLFPLLQAQGLDLKNVQDEYGNNLLHSYIMNTYSPELGRVKFLIEMGVPVDTPNKGGYTPKDRANCRLQGGLLVSQRGAFQAIIQLLQEAREASTPKQ